MKEVYLIALMFYLLMKKNIQNCLNSTTLYYLFLLFLGVNNHSANSQARIVINNASFININSGSFLVIDNVSNDAITRIGNTGWIISEGTIGNNRVKWKVGNTAATFTVPFGLGITLDLPLTFTTSDAVGNGSLIFSTFRSGINSASLPTAGTVVPQTMFPTNYLGSGNDNSAFGVDRFFQIDATDASFATRPNLSDLIFSYATAEWDATITGNTIAEENLRAQYWDNTAANWLPLDPLGTADIASNNVTVTSQSEVLLGRSKWWALVDESMPLPISLLTFTGECLNETIKIKWVTALEINNDYFNVERSADGINFTSISRINGAGNSTTTLKYSTIDFSPLKGWSYYRLKQTDLDGTKTTSKVIVVGECNYNIKHLSTYAYFNPDEQNIKVFIATDTPLKFSVALYNALGILIASKDIVSFAGKNQIAFEGLKQPDGVCVVVIRTSEKKITHKIIINNP
jgi:hypothetical protein